MRGVDSATNAFVYWESLGTPDKTPTITQPPLVGTLGSIFVLDEVGEKSIALSFISFLNAENRKNSLEYFDNNNPTVLRTFTAADIGLRGYDLDTKTFWDVKDVINDNPVWSSQNQIQFVQSSVSKKWRITHNMGRFPTVKIFVGTSEEEVFATITHLDNNNLFISFSAENSGKAYLS